VVGWDGSAVAGDGEVGFSKSITMPEENAARIHPLRDAKRHNAIHEQAFCTCTYERRYRVQPALPAR